MKRTGSSAIVKMRRHPRNVWILLCVYVFQLSLLVTADTSCSLSNPTECKEHEVCEQKEQGSKTGVCVCPLRLQDECKSLPVPTPPDPAAGPTAPTPLQPSHSHISASSIAVGTIVPLLFIVLGVGLVYSAYRYKWIQRLRQLRVRRYEEVLIGQEDDDDDPIA